MGCVQSSGKTLGDREFTYKRLSGATSSGKASGDREFTYKQLSAATGNFTEPIPGDYLFKGVLKSGQEVVVKRLRGPMTYEKMGWELLNLRVAQRHGRVPGIMNLIGSCRHGLLVYDYVQIEGILSDQLHLGKLDWDTRVKIAVAVAKALSHLHNDLNTALVHGNLSSSTILLDEDFNPKIYAFGCSRFGKHTETDVHGFGIVLMELISGTRTPSENGWPTPDPHLMNRYSREAFETLADLANSCLGKSPPPTMYHVVSNSCLGKSPPPTMYHVVSKLELVTANMPYKAATSSSTSSSSSPSS